MSYLECLVDRNTWSGSQGRHRCLRSGMADSGTHLLHTHNWRPDTLGHTDRNKRIGRNIGPLLETDHQNKWNPEGCCISLPSPGPHPALICFSSTITCPTNHLVQGQLAAYWYWHLPVEKPLYNKGKNSTIWGIFQSWHLCKTFITPQFRFSHLSNMHSLVCNEDPMTQSNSMCGQ